VTIRVLYAARILRKTPVQTSQGVFKGPDNFVRLKADDGSVHETQEEEGPTVTRVKGTLTVDFARATSVPNYGMYATRTPPAKYGDVSLRPA